MDDTYLTIAEPSEGLFKEKGSKFLSFAYPVSSAEQASAFVAEVRKRFFDARHVCYAYRIGFQDEIFRANDDGEPSGTAGRPIYGQILSNNLTDVLVVVVRYFGGILLGTGGLIVAYRSAAGEALAGAQIVERIVEQRIELRCSYEHLNLVMRIVKDLKISIIENRQTLDCHMTLSVRRALYDETIRQLEELRCITLIEATINPEQP